MRPWHSIAGFVMAIVLLFSVTALATGAYLYSYDLERWIEGPGITRLDDRNKGDCC